MDAFGPPDTQFFNRMFFVCAAPWFYPGTKGVDERMRGQRDGQWEGGGREERVFFLHLFIFILFRKLYHSLFGPKKYSFFDHCFGGRKIKECKGL